MPQPIVQLPSEVWSHVFGYLSTADKFRVRVSCKYFKKLIDHWTQWKDWTVVLTFPNGAYNSRFWSTLRRRKVSCAIVRSTKAKDWKQLASELPGLTTVLMDHGSKEAFDSLKHLTNLKRLYIKRSATLGFDTFTVSQPELLVHLSLCGVQFSKRRFCSTGDGLIYAISQFRSLTSLVCHNVGFYEEPVKIIHLILSCLPKLRHLSLSVNYSMHCIHSQRTNLGPLQASALSSLELVDFMDQSLPEELMKLLPCLKSLAIFYKPLHDIMGDTCSAVCHLSTWLRDLPQLSTLIVVKGPAVSEYVLSIPSSVTSLTLCVAHLYPKEMVALAAQVPNLLHLHIDTWKSYLGQGTAQIPHLFPKLRTLKVRHEHVPEKDFLSLQQLQDLEYLEMLDNLPQTSELTGKFRALSNNRIKTSRRQRDSLSCPCVSQVY